VDIPARPVRWATPRDLGHKTPDGIPYIAPEVLLLFKAKHLRPKDRHYFDLVVDKLNPDAREWLRQSLVRMHPRHAWIGRL
jgi:hypothetical protein